MKVRKAQDAVFADYMKHASMVISLLRAERRAGDTGGRDTKAVAAVDGGEDAEAAAGGGDADEHMLMGAAPDDTLFRQPTLVARQPGTFELLEGKAAGGNSPPRGIWQRVRALFADSSTHRRLDHAVSKTRWREGIELAHVSSVVR